MNIRKSKKNNNIRLSITGSNINATNVIIYTKIKKIPTNNIIFFSHLIGAQSCSTAPVESTHEEQFYTKSVIPSLTFQEFVLNPHYFYKMSLLTFSFDIFPALCILSNAKSCLKNIRWTHLSGKFNPSSNVKPSAFCYKGLGVTLLNLNQQQQLWYDVFICLLSFGQVIVRMTSLVLSFSFRMLSLVAIK